jgi:hypothetical protein
MTDPIAAGYGRLSRADIKRGETTENHLAILLRLAEHVGIPLAREQILFEIEQSDRLDTREGIQRLLEMCRRRQVTHVLTFDISRMTRGSERDWADIKAALFRGNITLVTPRGSYTFDNKLDTFALDVEACVARRGRWEYSFKRQLHNKEKAARGKRYGGHPPYGYRWVPATYDGGGRILTPGYAIVEQDEYEILQEIIRRIRIETACAICRDLNRRGILSPYAARGVAPPIVDGELRPRSGLWTQQSLRDLLRNPWLAGYIVNRSYEGREQGTVRLPREEWTWSEKPGDWPAPLTIEDWQEINDMLDARGVAGAWIGSPGLLSGILYCCRGRKMYLQGKSYCCLCARDPQPRHRGTLISKQRIESYAKSVAEAALAWLPRTALRQRKSHAARPKADIYAEISAALRDLDAKRRALSALLSGEQVFAELPTFGRETFTANVKKLSEEGEALQKRIEALRREAQQPDDSETRPLLLEVLARKEHLWKSIEGWTEPEIRRMMRLIIERIDLPEIPDGERYHQVAHVTMAHQFPGFPVPPLPTYRSVGGRKPGSKDRAPRKRRQT